jgi:hypothetical protein
MCRPLTSLDRPKVSHSKAAAHGMCLLLWRAIELVQERRTVLISAATSRKIHIRYFAPTEAA